MKLLLQLLYSLTIVLLLCCLLPAKIYALNNKTTADWKFEANDNGTYDVIFNWSDTPGTSSYSISLNTTPGTDPGPYADTRGTTWTFHNIDQNRTLYVNLKELRGRYSSNIYYWQIFVPAWVAPTKTPVESAAVTTTVNSGADYTIQFLITLGLGGFFLFSLILRQRYANIRKSLNEAKSNAVEIQDDNYTYAVLPPLVPLVEKPRKIPVRSSYSNRRRYYGRRYYRRYY